MNYRWRVMLHGDVFDLETAEEGFLLPDVFVLRAGKVFYLVGEIFEAFDTYKEVRSSAQETISTLNLTLRLTNPDFQSVKIGSSIIERRADGSSATHRWMYAEAGHVRIRGGVAVLKVEGQVSPPPRQPTLAERVALVAEANEYFASALRAFDAEPKNYKDLYIAYETVKKGSSPTQDFEVLIGLSWTTDEELKRFRETANYHRHGFPRKMRVPEMPLAEAEELVRRLLVNWAKKLSAGI